MQGRNHHRRLELFAGDLAFTSSGGLDAWLGEYRASDGDYVFERQMGSTGDDEAFGIAANAAGEICRRPSVQPVEE